MLRRRRGLLFDLTGGIAAFHSLVATAGADVCICGRKCAIPVVLPLLVLDQARRSGSPLLQETS